MGTSLHLKSFHHSCSKSPFLTIDSILRRQYSSFSSLVLLCNPENKIIQSGDGVAHTENEVSFILNLFSDGYSIGKPLENETLHLATRQEMPKSLHPYDRASETIVSGTLRYTQISTVILKNNPTKQLEVSFRVMASRLQIQGDESVLLRVTHSNIKTFSAEIRFSLQTTVEAVKDKLWRKCGTSVASMCLVLYDESNIKVSELNDNLRPLGFYSPHDGYRVHIIDLDPSSITSGGWLEDTSLVEKYAISEEAYAKLGGTFRKYKEKFISQNSPVPANKISDTYMQELCANVKVGDRCEVEPGEKRGVVKYVGFVESIAPGFWIGVQYDEPLGKHDGMVRGNRYFECPPLHGALVRPDKVKVGDYPERDIFEEDEI